MAKKTPPVIRGKVSKRRYRTHTDSIYEVTFENEVAKTCMCIYSPMGLTPINQPFGIDQDQINKSLSFELWKEITE